MSTSKNTKNHQEIKAWAEQRGGVPARISGTGKGSGDGLLRIHFPEQSDNDNNFEEISWDDFFEIFENNELNFLCQDKKADGDTSTFHKFVERDEEN